MQAFAEKRILFGVSLTVTSQNLNELTGAAFYAQLHKSGCRLVFLVEYVPVDPATHALALTDSERKQMETKLAALRTQFPAMLFLAFPGDEKAMGGCLAAGRGFFHINPYGAAEACPFAPYADVSLREKSLLEALQSGFFERLRMAHLSAVPHEGGCALFARRAQVEALLQPAAHQACHTGETGGIA